MGEQYLKQSLTNEIAQTTPGLVKKMIAKACSPPLGVSTPKFHLYVLAA